jgi:hypothetical protein
MHGMMSGMSWGMALVVFLGIAIVILVIAALVKYLF